MSTIIILTFLIKTKSVHTGKFTESDRSYLAIFATFLYLNRKDFEDEDFFIASMIVLLYVAYTSIMPVHAQNEVSVQKQNIYNSITVKIFSGERRGR